MHHGSVILQRLFRSTLFVYENVFLRPQTQALILQICGTCLSGFGGYFIVHNLYNTSACKVLHVLPCSRYYYYYFVANSTTSGWLQQVRTYSTEPVANER